MQLYEIFSGEDLRIAELIQRRRMQVLVHSCLYYGMDTNIVSDFQFDQWEAELVNLQKEYPHIAERVAYHNAFKDWDGSTGAFLPYDTPRIRNIANRILGRPWAVKVPTPEIKVPVRPVAKTQPVARRKLF